LSKDRGKTRTFNIPGDVPRLKALGYVRVRWTEATLRSRLDYLDTCIAQGYVPDTRGKRHVRGGRVSWECVPVPDDLREWLNDIETLTGACRDLLERQGVESAAEQMNNDLAPLVRELAARADPDRRRGRKTVESAREGGNAPGNSYAARSDQWQRQANELARRNPSLTFRDIARRIAREAGCSERTVRTHVQNPRT